MNITEEQETERQELESAKEMVLLKDVLTIIKDNFNDIHNQMKGRKGHEQEIIGGTITSLELEIKKDLKVLHKYK